MSLKLEVDSLAGLPPEMAGLYRPEGGRFKLDIAEPEAVTKALRAEREARKEAERSARDASEQLLAIRAERDRADQAASERDAARAQAEALRGRLFEAALSNAVQGAGLHKFAVDSGDVRRAALEKFTVGDDGSLVAKEGRQTFGDWIAAQKEVAPHWFPAAGYGSGAPMNARPIRSPSSISRAQFDALSTAQKQAVVRDGIPVEDR